MLLLTITFVIYLKHKIQSAQFCLKRFMQTESLIEKVLFNNPVVKILNNLIPRFNLIADLSNHFAGIFMKSIPSCWYKFLFTLGVAGLTYSAALNIRKMALWSSIFIQHKKCQSLLKAQKIKQKYGDCWVAITGFTQGIGWSFVQLLLKLNMKLVLIGRNQQKIRKKMNILVQKFPKAQLQIVIGDLSSQSDVQNICLELQQLSKRIDIGIVINNAGISKVGQYIDSKVKDILEISETNFNSVVQINKVMVPIMRNRKNRSAIINVSSCTGKFISHYLLSYSASKRMLNVYNDFLKKQNSDKIDVLLAMPFGVTTPMMKMKKQFFMISPDNCASSIIGDLLGGNLQTHGGLKHKIFGLIFSSLSEQVAANRFAVGWKKEF